ncbi:DUF971 domain-containing protein [Roseateles sp. NT4]|uniref:DUF971 domain-containing protein n=1 Tax=Roseateles sp. NT4 TaxID=3453715 RepID=UPI003EEF0D15
MTELPEAVDLTPAMLRLRWRDGATELPAARLRAACRCGDCRAGRSRSDERAAQLADARPVGQYALQLVFSDGHDRGIYPWVWLRELSSVDSTAAGLSGQAPPSLKAFQAQFTHFSSEAASHSAQASISTR